MDDFKSLDYQFNDFEDTEVGNSRQGQGHSNIPSQSQSRQMEGQRKPNFGALLNARQSGGGFKPQSFENSREAHRVPAQQDSQRPNLEKEATGGSPYPDWVMKAGKNFKPDAGTHDARGIAYDQDNKTRNQTDNATLNGVRAKERTHGSRDGIRSGNQNEAYRNSSAQNTQNSDDINQLLSKLKVEHRFNDWQTVEQKLRQVFEEDRMKSNELNDNRGGTRGQVDLVGTNRVRFSEPLAYNLPENQDKYANRETYTEYMVNNQNPNSAAKWGQQGRGQQGQSLEHHYAVKTNEMNIEQDQHGETTDTASNINETKGTRRNKNVRGSKNVNPKPGNVEKKNKKSAEQVNKTDESTTETRKGVTTNVDEDSSDEDESNDEEGHLNQWVEEAQVWGEEHGFPKPTPSEQNEQSGQNKEQNIIQQLTQIPMLRGNGRRQTGMPMAGLGNAFLGGQGEARLQQQLAGGGIPSMFGALSGQQGLGRGGGMPSMIPSAQAQGQGRRRGGGQIRGQGQGHGHGGSGMGGGEEDFDPANIDRNSSEYLQQVFAYESFKAKNNTCAKSDGMCTVLIVDTSSSVTDEPMIEIGQFLREFLDGVEANKSKHQLHENIAVITVGPEGEVLQHLTTDYGRIRTAMDSMQFDGPNPLFSGFMLVQAVLSGHTTQGISKLNGHAVRPRVILLSSGFLSGKAEGQWRQENKTQQLLCGEIVQNLAETVLTHLYCVQVGNANKDFLDSISTMTGGKLMTPDDAKLMSRSYIHHRVAANLRQTGGTDLSDRSSIKTLLVKDIQECSDADVDCVIEILKEGEPDLQERDKRMQQMMEVARQQQAQQGRVNEVQKMEQLQQLLGAMQGQGDEGLIDLLGQLQQEGAPGGGNLEELLRSVQSMQAGGGLGSMGGLGAAGRGGGAGGGMPFQLSSGSCLPQGLGGGLPPQLGGGGMPQGLNPSMLSQLGRSLGMPPQLGQGSGMPPRQSIPAGFYRGPPQLQANGFFRGQAGQQQGQQ